MAQSTVSSTHSTDHSLATLEAAQSMGLKSDEYDKILTLLGRTPNMVELSIYSVMWSEHCSYKSSRIHLKKLPTSAPQVIYGPGENAGVVDIGDGEAVVFKIESHNHPSFIEPYQGAATGVGGIMRDVFTMGARPIANLNALRFGDPSHPKTRALVAGVVAGIGGYGNSMGVPTVGGETQFDSAYNGNILVNAMTVGIAKKDKIFTSAATGVGNRVVYVGAKTGRDGIHGATMASTEFTDDTEAKRPTVQVGDPFKEKLLLEACLELMATDAIIAIQDMGAAGLTSSSVEMASKGGCGIRLNLDLVPMRETGMEAMEIMLSESQERMVMIIKPESEALAQKIFQKWELDCAVIGTLTDSGKIELFRHGKLVCDLPLAPLVDAAPLYDRPYQPTVPLTPCPDSHYQLPPNTTLLQQLEQLLMRPNFASRHWIWQQFDHLVGGNTIIPPGGDAAIVRLEGQPEGRRKGLAMAVDCNPHYCLAAPELGGAQAVVEVWRNLVAVGAKPLALTNNLNFGNPERAEIMGQLVGCLAGMSAACRALELPIVSGNVSLYNETNGAAIMPTPVVGGVALIEDVARAVTLGFKQNGDRIFVLQAKSKLEENSLARSAFVREMLGEKTAYPAAAIDYDKEIAAAKLLLQWARDGRIQSLHDVSDGGLLVALAEMAMAGAKGCQIQLPTSLSPLATGFGEGQWSYCLTLLASEAEDFATAAKAVGLVAWAIGEVCGSEFILGSDSIAVSQLSVSHRSFFDRFMAGTIAAH